MDKFQGPGLNDQDFAVMNNSVVPEHANFQIEEAQWVATDLGYLYAYKLGAIYYALEVRQYNFDDHDQAFEEFDQQITSVDAGTAEVKIWIDAHPEAVQWALDFAGIQLPDNL